MKSTLIARTTSLALTFLLLASQAWATCGGGGGGGMGGMGGGSGPGGGSSPQVYAVPWKIIQPADSLKEGLAVYWLPATQQELERSSLRESHTLANYATQCVTMGIVDYRTELGQKFATANQLPTAVVVQADGTVVARLENTGGKLKVGDLEKLLDNEMKKREAAVKEKIESAKGKIKAGDNQGAIQELRAVYEQKCLFPGKAKDAAKELKKLGVEVADVPNGPTFDPILSARIEKTMRAGLKAENAAKYVEAERLYQSAHQMDPADPVPLRFLGELYRHHIGDWAKAREVFDSILAMPADPMSRAVALHGLGKMTIHEGDFLKGLHLMEASVREYPLALAYRNLAVYWNSEGDRAKADFYTQEALKLAPKDPYNLIFAAAFMAGNGHGEEALKIARENEAVLPASYNLAAIYAQAGQRDKALALLKRHFFEYERYQAVRSKEMMEARVDAVFASLMNDKEFMALTSGADGMLPMRMSPNAKPVGN
ncbi:MAG TPA: tetratricopeptide repeat protein [Candidatus Angelobacter sp.]|nr:tetratricopeptide repeat protein [Candidatus Angelobacter sp.]